MKHRRLFTLLVYHMYVCILMSVGIYIFACMWIASRSAWIQSTLLKHRCAKILLQIKVALYRVADLVVL